MNTQEPQPQNDFERQVDDLVEELVEESLDHEYAVYVRLHEDGGWPAGALEGLVADLHSAHPRVEPVNDPDLAPEHDVVLSIDGDGLDAQGAARHALERIGEAAAARGLTGHAADVTVLSDSAVWTYGRDEVDTW
ncbi:hypothetical protein [Kineococcus sp. SYSU DK003]|uniref:hypothetical protein n=1 Tax=Kineococcus sp. SYSU DK003 TaxID=3383124 RepID=UPI003D7CCF4F